MMDANSRRFREIAAMLLAVAFFLSMSIYLVSAAPQGATVQANSVDAGPNRTAGSLTHPGGRIINVNLNSEQQNPGWKAYIGNVSGLYVLQNGNNASIYEWPLSTVGGEVYISRNSSVNFGGIACANTANMTLENNFLGYLSTDDISINRTFNSTNHRSFDVGTTPISANSCPATALWVNDTVQTQSQSATWQEVILTDGDSLVYASLMNSDKSGFDTNPYDFQAIIAENRTSPTGTTYYFYIELGN